MSFANGNGTEMVIYTPEDGHRDLRWVSQGHIGRRSRHHGGQGSHLPVGHRRRGDKPGNSWQHPDGWTGMNPARQVGINSRVPNTSPA